MNKSPRVHTPAFKAQVALAALKGDRTLSEIAAHYQVHVKLVQAWKKQMLDQAATVFTGGVKPTPGKDTTADPAELFEQIGRLKVELEWVKKKAAAFL
jgi:transposase-like protein